MKISWRSDGVVEHSAPISRGCGPPAAARLHPYRQVSGTFSRRQTAITMGEHGRASLEVPPSISSSRMLHSRRHQHSQRHRVNLPSEAKVLVVGGHSHACQNIFIHIRTSQQHLEHCFVICRPPAFAVHLQSRPHWMADARRSDPAVPADRSCLSTKQAGYLPPSKSYKLCKKAAWRPPVAVYKLQSRPLTELIRTTLSLSSMIDDPPISIVKSSKPILGRWPSAFIEKP